MRSWAAAVVFLACATFARAQVGEFSLSGGVSRFGDASLGSSLDASGNTVNNTINNGFSDSDSDLRPSDPGGIATLNHRLMADKPPAWERDVVQSHSGCYCLPDRYVEYSHRPSTSVGTTRQKMATAGSLPAAT